jgi:hypothetical protein
MLKEIWNNIKHNYLPYPFAYLAKGLLRLLMFTCRVEIRGLPQFIRTAADGKCILMLWHNRLALVPEIMNRFAPQFIYRAFISKSRDGEPLAILANSYSCGRTLRVPHNARHQALSQMINLLKSSNEIMVVTPDGPRGPLYQIKPGIIVAAKEAAARIIPFSWRASRYWELGTWDKFMLPKPFSRIVVTIGDPIFLDKKTGTDKSEDLAHLHEAMENLRQ